MSTATERPSVGLALSGGGFRATAFGLGALRALHDRGVLPDVRVVSGISGGSLLTAMWAYGPEDFGEFDSTVTDLLGRGLQMELIKRTFTPGRTMTNILSATSAALPGGKNRPRQSSRTEALVDALASRAFGVKEMAQVTHPKLSTVISATDLSTGNAVRFGSDVSSCSPHGTIIEPVPVADAVAASAAFPVLLPQLNRTYTFTRTDGTQHIKTMSMTDGGVYDNLGISPLLPGRSRQHTSHVYDLDYIIAVDAGPGRTAPRAPNFMLGRLKRSFEIAHTRNQDGSRARVHELAAAGHVKGFVYSYLGMRDSRLPIPIADLVEREQVAAYPTNFARMAPADLQAVAIRGEQLTRTLIEFYCPQLGA
ncbi:NTE family protein [Micromonospora echinaurantiaca]|uniref:NTE family protein n=1 Tax=Micromonospora echinaurantiaca TaxID=47857 RepID=A0A1C5IIV7_9ACTN|nr:patatin-like phospholipase family protein [Micromonospora echinaurantiaca]SCG58214.1 NTE family protein [Micromonospora echinaurantiaca]